MQKSVINKVVKITKTPANTGVFVMIVANCNSLQFMQRFVPIVSLVGLCWIAGWWAFVATLFMYFQSVSIGGQFIL